MGDPPRQRSNFRGPSHPWQKARIDEERILKKDYGLVNKREIWKANSLLSNFARQAKRLIASSTKQGETEKEQLLKRLEGKAWPPFRNNTSSRDFIDRHCKGSHHLKAPLAKELRAGMRIPSAHELATRVMVAATGLSARRLRDLIRK